uniref:Uncharacterized protein n=1 Tax=viral metagenome TaxID=1070528 RepID=A0A6C0IYT6_9ZZZZ
MKTAAMSQTLLADIFKYYTVRGFVLHRLSLDPPPQTYSISPWQEPDSGETYRTMYVDSVLGEITKMEPLSTLEAVIAVGSEYVRACSEHLLRSWSRG